MATASIILSKGNESVVSVIRIDNRGSAASLSSDLAECFAALSSIPAADPARLGAEIAAYYSAHATVNPSIPIEPNYDDNVHVLLNCSNLDGSGRPTGQFLSLPAGDLTSLVYG
tara:strand:+ start:148 stop:489 length:342 start_codon:yes stop_codon:yes gene_type:complete